MTNLVKIETAAQALAHLKDANQAYIRATYNSGDISAAIRKDTTQNGQHPYAVVLTCADSRMVPEHIFMEGLGRLFTIRNAGNVVDDTTLGSMEYAVEHLGAKLIVVLGHNKCGAVAAAISNGGHDHIVSICQKIAEGIGQETDPAKAELANVQYSCSLISQSPLLAKHIQSDSIKVVGALYDIETGVVEFLD